MNIENLKKLIEQAQGKSANEFWLATGKRPTDVIVELAKALEEKDQKIEAMKAEAEGTNQRIQMIFEAKNHWAERARAAELRLQQPILLPRVAAIYANLSDVGRHRTSPENVRDVVDAIQAHADSKVKGAAE